MASVIGTVTKIVGIAILVDEQGKRHLLKQGESLHEGDRVITSQGTTVTVSYSGGGTANLNESQTILMTDQLVPAVSAEASEIAVNMAVFKQIISALNAGQDITELLDYAAAGTVEGEGGTTFVNLDRIDTDVNRLAFLLGGSEGSDNFSSQFNIQYASFNASSTSTPPPPLIKVQETIESPILSGNVLVQVGGTIQQVDNSISLVNANAIAGVLTESNTLVDNSNSIVNAGLVAGVLSGDTTVNDNSLSLVNAGVVPGLLSDSTSVKDTSTSLVNAGLVPILLSDNATVTDQSNAFINANLAPSLLSGNSVVNDQSNNLVNLDVVPTVLSGNSTVNDQSDSPIDVDIPLTLLSNDGTLVDSGVAADVLGASIEAPLEPNNLIMLSSTDLDPSILLQDQGTPNPLDITTTVLDGTLGEIVNPTTPLSAGDVLTVENALVPNLNLESFTNTTTADSEVLCLVNPPLAVNTLLVEQNILNLH